MHKYLINASHLLATIDYSLSSLRILLRMERS